MTEETERGREHTGAPPVDMPEPSHRPPDTVEGWYALHDFRRIDWRRWKRLSETTRRRALDQVETYARAAAGGGEAGAGWSGFYTVLGHKADLLQLHLRSTLEDLAAAERQFAATVTADVTERTYSYTSVTELSQYLSDGKKDEEPSPGRQKYMERRLKPDLSGYPYICFYPMDKRRGESYNWYALPIDERREMMKSHGMIGRKYRGKVTQMITGSVGFDDWEWGVTLAGKDPVQFKKLVYEMRFDEASSRYAEFGPFYTGLRLRPGDIAAYLQGDTRAVGRGGGE